MLIDVAKSQSVDGPLRAPFFKGCRDDRLVLRAWPGAPGGGEARQPVAGDRRGRAARRRRAWTANSRRRRCSDHRLAASDHGEARDLYITIAERLGDFEEGRALTALVKSNDGTEAQPAQGSGQPSTDTRRSCLSLEPEPFKRSVRIHLVPLRRALVGERDAQRRRLVVEAPGHHQHQRRVGDEAGPHRDRGMAGQVGQCRGWRCRSATGTRRTATSACPSRASAACGCAGRGCTRPPARSDASGTCSARC